jgi:hypothetical protein
MTDNQLKKIDDVLFRYQSALDGGTANSLVLAQLALECMQEIIKIRKHEEETK